MALVVGGGAFAYHLRESDRDKDAWAARETGIRHYEEGEYPEAIDDLRKFINRAKEDADPKARLVFAQAVLKLPDPEARHLEERPVVIENLRQP